MQAIKKMDHSQMETKLTEAYLKGYEKAGEYITAQEQDRIFLHQSWRDAVKQSISSLPGIGPKRKELFAEYLKENLKKAGICIE